MKSNFCILFIIILAFVSCEKTENNRIVDFKVYSPVKFTGYRIERDNGKFTLNSSPISTKVNSTYIFESNFEANKGDAVVIYFLGYASSGAEMLVQKISQKPVLRLNEKETMFTIIVE